MKAAVVLGASGEIGSSIAKTLAEEGWSLYMQGFKHMEKVTRMAEAFSLKFPKQDFFALSCDLSDEDALHHLITSLFNVDAIVFAQGYTYRSLFTDITSDEMDKMWKVHVKVPLLLVQALQPKLARSGRGRVVFISSVYGHTGSPMEVYYSMTKGAQDAFVKAYSKEGASLGITVNAVAPGAISTSMNDFLEDTERIDLKREIPAGRFGTPEDVSFWVSQLLKKESDYLTGQIITVSGGWLN